MKKKDKINITDREKNLKKSTLNQILNKKRRSPWKLGFKPSVPTFLFPEDRGMTGPIER